ncbi:Unknown protein sequence [Pseudomonas syringae pv. aceris]|nr:Unknown protein sequence [Pseudomonas syringae pv. aceris]
MRAVAMEAVLFNAIVGCFCVASPPLLPRMLRAATALAIPPPEKRKPAEAGLVLPDDQI